MDPDETLRQLLELSETGCTDEAFEWAENLFNWLRNGGFKPVVLPGTYVSVGDGVTAYSILWGRDRAVFIKYTSISGSMTEHSHFILPVNVE